jgi:hypothetical protein
MTDEDIESDRQVGQVLAFEVEFGCFVERRSAKTRRIRYEVRINGVPSSASLTVEGELGEPSVADAEIEGACAYIQRFLREGLHGGIEIILREAIHQTHLKGGLTNRAFLKAVSDFIKDASDQRLGSKVAKRKRHDWRRFEATAKVRRDTTFFKQYRAEYKRLYREYIRNTRRRNQDQFVKDIWRDYERVNFGDRPPKYLEIALRVAQASRGDLTPKQAALQRVGKELGLSANYLDRTFMYRKKKKPTKSTSI